MSSSEPEDTRRLGAELASLGLALVDAPVSGGVPRAITGQLTIMIGGEAGSHPARKAGARTHGQPSCSRSVRWARAMP